MSQSKIGITFTGADDNTSVDEMVSLLEKYDAYDIEFGLLCSSTKYCQPRYPCIKTMMEMSREFECISLHLCGQLVESIRNGSMTAQMFMYLFDFPIKRIQLNCGSRISVILNDNVCKFATEIMYENNTPLIIGGNWSNVSFQTINKAKNNIVQALFDCSGGHGIEIEDIPTPFGNSCGYAGGINVNNILEKAALIKAKTMGFDGHVWIDMESSLRNRKDEFDLSICAAILERLPLL